MAVNHLSEKLPEELLASISGYLNHSTILDLSLVNRKLSSACRPLKFRSVKLSFSSPETLSLRAKELIDILGPSSAFKHVRHVEILPAKVKVLEANEHIQGVHWVVDRRATHLLTQQSQWRDLVTLINNLTALREFTWTCAEQIPHAILQILHTLQPRCRLRINNFRLRTLETPPGLPIVIDPLDLEIVTSPCLYGLSSLVSSADEFRDFNEGSIMEMIAGAAPNLKEVSLGWRPGGITVEIEHGGLPVQIPWNIPPRNRQPGLTPSPSTVPQGSLETLELHAQGRLRSMSAVTDFACLRTLKLNCWLFPDDMNWLASECEFPHLEHLHVPCVRGDNQNDVLESFLVSLPSLTSVTFPSTFDYGRPRLYKLFKHLGHRLRRLHHQAKCFDIELVKMLLEYCPCIEELSVGIYRRRGSALDVDIYRSLGRLSTLRTIKLIVSDWQPSSDIFDLKAAIFRRLKALAIDETLARSVFHTISSSRPRNASPLEYLYLVPGVDGGRGGYDDDICDLFTYIGRSWECTRSLRDDAHDSCFVKDAGESVNPPPHHHYHGFEYMQPRAIEYAVHSRARRAELEDEGVLEQMVHGRWASVIESVWPESRERPLKDVWHSFPASEIENMDNFVKRTDLAYTSADID